MVYEEVIATAFQNHSYRWPVIGWMSDLKDLKLGDLMNHYQTYYAPNNAVIIVVGDVEKGDIVSKITAAFGDIPEGPEIQRPKIEEGPQRGEKRLFVKKEAELPFIVSAYKVPDIKHEDGFALDVLGSILSDGKSSRLYQKLVYQQQIALSAWAGYEGLYKDPFLFLTGATAASGKNIEEVEKAINDEIEKIKKAPPSEIEVQKAKNQIEASFIMGQDSIYMQAKMIGTFEMIGGWRLWERYLEGIRRVSPEDVRHVAEKYLVSDARTTGILMPLKADRK
jgi:zinc protease